MSEQTIHKYPLEITFEQKVMLPKDFSILSLQVQNNVPCLWAIVSPDAEKVERTIFTIGTGHPANAPAIYIGTYQIQDHPERPIFVGHVFIDSN